MRRAYQLGAVLVALGGTGLIVFLALMSNPDVGHLHVLPRRWSYLLDQHHGLRHVVGYFGFYLLLAVLSATTGWFVPLRRRLALLAGLCLFAAVLELAQIFVPRRSVNFSEVLASWTGLLLAFFLTEGFRLLLHRFRKPAVAARAPHVD